MEGLQKPALEIKQGVGFLSYKSTTCACLGAALTELGKRVLMVDLDPQAGLTTSLGHDPGAFEKTIYNALIDDEISIEGITTETKVPNLFFLPANLDLGVFA